jgi:hypothetical protein
MRIVFDESYLLMAVPDKSFRREDSLMVVVAADAMYPFFYLRLIDADNWKVYGISQIKAIKSWRAGSEKS